MLSFLFVFFFFFLPARISVLCCFEWEMKACDGYREEPTSKKTTPREAPAKMINHLIPLARLIITLREVNAAHTRDVSKCSLRPSNLVSEANAKTKTKTTLRWFNKLQFGSRSRNVYCVDGSNGQRRSQVSATITASRELGASGIFHRIERHMWK